MKLKGTAATLTSADHLEARKARLKRLIPAIAGPVVVGIVNLIRSWQKHDLEAGIVAVVLFFVLAPLLVSWISKYDWTR